MACLASPALVGWQVAVIRRERILQVLVAWVETDWPDADAIQRYRDQALPNVPLTAQRRRGTDDPLLDQLKYVGKKMMEGANWSLWLVNDQDIRWMIATSVGLRRMQLERALVMGREEAC